jgi:hypothetical protein
MKVQYAVVRKEKGSVNWKTCTIYDNGRRIAGARTTNYAIAEREKRSLQELFSNEKYAIVIMEE